jgi:TrpR-related protein YerC/YecD
MKKHRGIHAPEQAESEQRLYEAIALIQTAEEAQTFFNDLCTPMELQSMVDRWRVLELLKQGKPYRKIYEETGVSVTTVGRVARSVMLGDGGYNLIYERLKTLNPDR